MAPGIPTASPTDVYDTRASLWWLGWSIASPTCTLRSSITWGSLATVLGTWASPLILRGRRRRGGGTPVVPGIPTASPTDVYDTRASVW